MEQEFIGVEVSGARELRKIVRRVGGPDATDALKQIHRDAASMVAREATRLVERDTGQLESTILSLIHI